MSDPHATSTSPPPPPSSHPELSIPQQALEYATQTLDTANNVFTFLTTYQPKSRQEALNRLPAGLGFTSQTVAGIAVVGGVTGGGECASVAEKCWGWYMYHKQKRDEVIHRAGVEGLKYAGRFAGIAGVFCTVETGVEGMMGVESWVCSGVAGLTTASLYSLGMRLSSSYIRYALIFGTVTGMCMGGVRDVYAIATGESVKYPDRKRTGSHAFWVPGWDWKMNDIDGVMM
ncbi:hypothetical protein BC829DRAFT_487089, partial [Chytridium lagenaria]